MSSDRTENTKCTNESKLKKIEMITDQRIKSEGEAARTIQHSVRKGVRETRLEVTGYIFACAK